MKNGILVLNRVTNRYSISFDNGEHFELHCGDIFECSPELNDWIPVRIEYNDEWYLIDRDDNKIAVWENMLARK